MRQLIACGIAILFTGCGSTRTITLSPRGGEAFVVVYQPSHQTDTGKDFSEAEVCNAIAENAIRSASHKVRVHKVWSVGVDSVHHSRAGSNTKIDHTAARDSLGRMSGYAYEILLAKAIGPDVFVALHNNGGTNRNAVWGYVHEGDSLEPANRELAALLAEAISDVTGMENRGVYGDSSPNRNDYRCINTGKLSFYSLDENNNRALIRVLMEIGDNAVSRAILVDPSYQKKMGEAIQTTVERWLAD